MAFLWFGALLFVGKGGLVQKNEERRHKVKKKQGYKITRDKIPNHKQQITNKFQIPIFKFQIVLNLEFWLLNIVCNLEFVICDFSRCAWPDLNRQSLAPEANALSN